MGFLSKLLGRDRDPTETRQSANVSTKTWQEASDVLLEMSAFQNQLGQLFDEYRERTNSPRLQMLLDLLSGRAYQCEKDLATYTKDMPAALKRTRIQFRMSHSPRSLLGELCDVSNPTSDDVTDVGFKADDYFASVFKELIALSEANGTRKLQKVFENMWELEQEAKKSFARQVDSLRDI